MSQSNAPQSQTPAAKTVGDFLAGRVPGIDPAKVNTYVRERLEFKISRLIRKCGVPEDEADDIQQDMLLCLIQGLSSYHSGASKWKTYISGILNRRYRHHLRQYICREQHDVMKPVPIEELSPESSEFIGNFVDPVHDYHVSDMEADVAMVIKRLPPKLQAICSLLSQYPAGKAAKIAGFARSKLYRYIAVIRSEFARAGFSEKFPRSLGQKCGRGK